LLYCPEKKKTQIELQSKTDKQDLVQLKPKDDDDFNSWFDAIEKAILHFLGEEKLGLLIFGAPLAAGCKEGEIIPHIVKQCIQYIDERALHTEGIFRLSGSQALIDKYKALYNKGVDMDISQEPDPHTVAGLLKLYFREMPEPILTFDGYEMFIQAQGEPDTEKRISYIRGLIQNLPKINQAVLKYLVEFLIRVEKFHEVNKMAIHNLATVFAPNLLSPKEGEKNMLEIVEDTPQVHGLVNTLIKDFTAIFADEPEPITARAMYDYTGQSESEITFKAGDLVKVTKQGNEGWWTGELNGKSGMFPASYVKPMPPGASKRQKFIEDMDLVRKDVDDKTKIKHKMTEAKEQLSQENKNIQTAKEKISLEGPELKTNLSQILESTFKAKFESYYSQLEAYQKNRVTIQKSKTSLIDTLQNLLKFLPSEAKLKSKDKLTTVTEALLSKAKDEQAARKLLDEKKSTFG